jgi:maltoporin
MAMEGPNGRFLSASTFAAKIAAAGNLTGSKDRSGYACSKILDALIPATPEASPVSSTQNFYLSLDNPSLHFSKHGLAFLQIQADLFEPDSGCRPLDAGYQLAFQNAAVEARFDPNSKLHRSLPPRLGPRGKRLPEGTTRRVPPPTLIQSPDTNPPNTPDAAQRLQQAVTNLANNGPSVSAQQQSPSGSNTGTQQQVTNPAADQASREKTERSIAGKNEGKTPTYQNLNDQQNPAIQQAKAFEFHGYLRSGEGINSHGGQQVAFEAPGAPAKYRPGNETDTYGEFVFVNNWVNTHAPRDHAWFHTEVLISADTTESAQGDSTDTFNLKEAFVRGGNLFASHPDWKFWAGERYYRRWNIDQIDWYMQDMSGYGGGIEDVHLGGPVKIAFAYLGGVIDADQLKSGPFLKNTFDLDWYGLRGFHGKFGGRVYYSSAKGGQLEDKAVTVPGAHGYGIEVGHNIKNLLGGNDRTVVQYATGEAANFYTTALTPEPWIKNATGLRVTNQFLIEPGDPYERFSIFATTAYQRYKSLNTANAVDSWISFGGRPQWYFTNHFNIALEAAADHVIEGSGNYSGWLRKVTFAPEVSAGRGYYSRPAVRLFFTYASWTDGFKGRVGGPAFLNLKQGITAGLQFENWW